MRTKPNRHRQNVPGKFYIDNASCAGCGVCIRTAPSHFKREDPGFYEGRYEGRQAFVYRQPETDGERKDCLEALKHCPVWAIHDDGEMPWVASQQTSSTGVGERYMTVIAPETLCYDDMWGLDSNVIVVLTHLKNSELPDFEQIFSFWIHRRENLVAFLKANSNTQRMGEIQIVVHSKNVNCYPLFSYEAEFKSPKWLEPPDDEYFPEWRKIHEQTEIINLPVMRLANDIGITAFTVDVSSWCSATSFLIQLVSYGLILAEEHIELDVDSHSDDSTKTIVCKSFQRIFASYSRKDLKVVEWVDSFLRNLGVGELRWDLKVLRSGDEWEEKINQEIESADSFQLFWSDYAKGSRFVRNEWKFALQLQRSGFIKPVFWTEPMPKPPKALKHLNFSKLPL